MTIYDELAELINTSDNPKQVCKDIINFVRDVESKEERINLQEENEQIRQEIFNHINLLIENEIEQERGCNQ